jgi:hypothetical protein
MSWRGGKGCRKRRHRGCSTCFIGRSGQGEPWFACARRDAARTRGRLGVHLREGDDPVAGLLTCGSHWSVAVGGRGAAGRRWRLAGPMAHVGVRTLGEAGRGGGWAARCAVAAAAVGLDSQASLLR